MTSIQTSNFLVIVSEFGLFPRLSKHSSSHAQREREISEPERVDQYSETPTTYSTAVSANTNNKIKQI